MYPFAIHLSIYGWKLMPFLESVSNCTPSSLNWSTLSYWVPSELLILGVKSLFVAVLKLIFFNCFSLFLVYYILLNAAEFFNIIKVFLKFVLLHILFQ